MSKYYLILLFFISPFLQSFSQNSHIKGIINTYTKITNINVDEIEVASIQNISAGDIVMIFQATGAELDIINTNVILDLNNTGRFEILIVQSVGPGLTITCESEIENTYDLSESIQLIKIPEYEVAIVDSTLTCKTWDGQTGGVLALIANQRLELQADINVSMKGFRGGNPDDQEEYIGDCSDALDSAYYYKNTLNEAAFKGEGFVQSDFDKTRGYGPNANGGGGGNGKFFGGAGGANVVYGGNGGYEFEECGEDNNNLFAAGGQFDAGVNEFYFYPGQRITLGGGGGTSTQNKSQGFVATKGGNGGGIVLVIADSIKSNGNAIRANGESITTDATAGGGGGGGGGAILLETKNFIDNNLKLQANGGKGGDTFHDTYLLGPGGGGGMGVIWYSSSALPSAIRNNLECKEGLSGSTTPFNFDDHFASSGNDTLPGFASVKNKMVLPLNGFLFNKIYSDQYICMDEIPAPLRGTSPKGGDGTFTYQWQQKQQGGPWTDIGSNNDSLLYYFASGLTDTTFFRRVVTSAGATLNDTSKIITIFVHDPVTGNGISSDQLLCNNESPNPLTGNVYSGGDYMNYYFQWESSPNNSDYDTVPGAHNETFSPGALTDSTYFRRVITSGACSLTSNSVLIQVLDPIENNNISSNQDVCYNLTADQLIGTNPTGGDNANYSYLWEESNNQTTWANASGTNDQSNYEPGNLTQTKYFRRTVSSGAGWLCIHVSDTVKIDVLESITNNTISQDDTVCTNDLITLTGNQPEKGNGEYAYNWISSPNQSSWISSPAPLTSLNSFTSNELVNDMYFKRVIYSGINSACIDTSNQVFVKVLETISGNSIDGDREICHTNSIDNLVGTATLSGGISDYTYTWEYRPDGGNYTDLQGSNSQSSYSFAFDPDPGLYYIRRKVTSNACVDYSDSVSLNVQSAISGNNISNNTNVCLETAPPPFTSSTLAGGDNSYSYSWLQSADGENFTAALNQNTVALYQANELNSLTYFQRVVNSGQCIDSSNVFNIDVLPLPTSSIVTPSDTICEGDAIQIDFTLTGTAPWEISYSNENDEDQKFSIETASGQIELEPTSNYIFTTDSVKDGNGCYANEISGQTNISVYAAPPANAGRDTSICGDELTLYGSTGYDAQWQTSSPDLSFSDDNLPNTTLITDSYGEYELTYNTFDWICTSSDNIYVTFYQEPDQAAFEVEGDIELNLVDNFILNAIEPSVGIGTWSYPESDSANIQITDINDPNSQASIPGNSEREYTLYWTVSNGVCPSTRDSLTVKKTNDIIQGFSPNNDGVNDAYIIGGDRKINLKVVNRWGQEVFSDPDYQNDWKGTGPNGDDLPEGTYFYILQLDDDDPRKGYIIIRR